MRDVTDEALQRLYWACRRHEDFPGPLPDESRGNVTTYDILVGLGLVRQDLREWDFVKDLKASPLIKTDRLRHHQEPLPERLWPPAETKASLTSHSKLPSALVNVPSVTCDNALSINTTATTTPELIAPPKAVTPVQLLPSAPPAFEGKQGENQTQGAWNPYISEAIRNASQSAAMSTHFIEPFNLDGFCDVGLWAPSSTSPISPPTSIDSDSGIPRALNSTNISPHSPSIVYESYL